MNTSEKLAKQVLSLSSCRYEVAKESGNMFADAKIKELLQRVDDILARSISAIDAANKALNTHSKKLKPFGEMKEITDTEFFNQIKDIEDYGEFNIK